MANKKSNFKNTTKKKPSLNIKAKITQMVDYEDSNVKAVASITIADAFAFHGVKVIESKNGLFVSMPQSKYTKDGEQKYSDVCHPISSEARAELNSVVLKAYEEQLEMRENQTQDMTASENEDITPQM